MEKQINEIKINLMEFRKDIGYIKNSLDKNEQAHKEIMDKIDVWFSEAEGRFVDKKEFKPVRIIVYGMVGFILIAFLSSIIGLVVF